MIRNSLLWRKCTRVCQIRSAARWTTLYFMKCFLTAIIWFRVYDEHSSEYSHWTCNYFSHAFIKFNWIINQISITDFTFSNIFTSKSAFTLGLWRSIGQNKSKKHQILIGFNKRFPLRMTGTYAIYANYASIVHQGNLASGCEISHPQLGHLLLFEERFHVLLETFPVPLL